MTDKRSKLSPEDIQQLLTDPSDSVRADIAVKVAQEVEAKSLTAEEREIANAILRGLVKDAAERVRKSLSESLRYADNLPHDIALTLAKDIETVSLPLLETSPILSDDDLIEIISGGSQQKQIAIAGRPVVADRVAQAIVETDNTQAVTTLAGNEGAELSETTYASLIDRYGTSTEVTEALAHREDLPITISEKLITLVSGRLRDYLQLHTLNEGQTDQLIQESRERATVDLVEKAAHTANVLALANQLKSNGRLTPSLILRAIFTGDVRFFEAALSVLSQVPLKRAAVLIHDTGSLGLKSIFERSGLPGIYLPAYRVALDVYREMQNDGGDEDRERFRARMIERILTQYQDVDTDDIEYLIKSLQNHDGSKAA